VGVSVEIRHAANAIGATPPIGHRATVLFDVLEYFGANDAIRLLVRVRLGIRRIRYKKGVGAVGPRDRFPHGNLAEVESTVLQVASLHDQMSECASAASDFENGFAAVSYKLPEHLVEERKVRRVAIGQIVNALVPARRVHLVVRVARWCLAHRGQS